MPSIEAWTGRPQGRLAVGQRRPAHRLALGHALADLDRRLAGAPRCCFSFTPTRSAANSFRSRVRRCGTPQSQLGISRCMGALRLPMCNSRPRGLNGGFSQRCFSAASRRLFCVQTFFGVEVLRAGVEAAQVALAAELRADHVRLAHQVEPQAPHRPVRLDRMAQQPPRAKLGAEAALVARAAADADDLLPILPAPADDHVVVGQHDHAAGGLVHQGVVVLFAGSPSSRRRPCSWRRGWSARRPPPRTGPA